MIISHKFKFIFIHIPKNAGTSIVAALNKACGEEFYKNFKKISVEDVKKYGLSSKQIDSWNYHLPAKDIRKIIGEKIWNSYFKFAFVRNPSDRVLSLYSFTRNYTPTKNDPKEFRKNMISIKSMKNLSEYLNNYLPSHSNNQLDYISDSSGKIIIDFVGRVENIEQDFNSVCKIIGVNAILDKFNMSEKVPDDIMFLKQNKKLIEFYFKKDYQTFGYNFTKVYKYDLMSWLRITYLQVKQFLRYLMSMKNMPKEFRYALALGLSIVVVLTLAMLDRLTFNFGFMDILTLLFLAFLVFVVPILYLKIQHNIDQWFAKGSNSDLVQRMEKISRLVNSFEDRVESLSRQNRELSIKYIDFMESLLKENHNGFEQLEGRLASIRADLEKNEIRAKGDINQVLKKIDDGLDLIDGQLVQNDRSLNRINIAVEKTLSNLDSNN